MYGFPKCSCTVCGARSICFFFVAICTFLLLFATFHDDKLDHSHVNHDQINLPITNHITIPTLHHTTTQTTSSDNEKIILASQITSTIEKTLENYTFTTLIPNIVHYIWIDTIATPFPFIYYFGIASVKAIENPQLIIFHYISEPIQDLIWNNTKKLVTLSKLNALPTHWSLNKPININKPAHISDAIRLQIIKTFGGIYLDFDTIAVHSYKNIIDSKNVSMILGFEGGKGLANAVIISSKESKFIQLWFNKYARFYRYDGWADASVVLPYKLSLQYPNLIHCQAKESFFYPNYWAHKTRFELNIFENQINNRSFRNDIFPKMIIHHWYHKSASVHYKEITQMITSVNWAKRYSYTLFGQLMINALEQMQKLDKKLYQDVLGI